MMDNSNNFNTEHLGTVLSAIIKDIETARWAIFEMKVNSETGMMLKSIVVLANLVTLVEKENSLNSNLIMDYLLTKGYDKNRVFQVVKRLYHNAMN